jgi:hypothetical protein
LLAAVPDQDVSWHFGITSLSRIARRLLVAERVFVVANALRRCRLRRRSGPVLRVRCGGHL